MNNRVNLQILQLLASSRLYTREIAKIIGKDETEISRRINQLRKAGLIECTWERIGDKNVKLCRSLVKEIKYKFKGNKIIVEIEYYNAKTGKYIEFSSKQYQSIPIPKNFIGRKSILEKLAKTNANTIIVWGLPGTGKTLLVAKYVSELNKPIFWYNVSEFSSLRHFILNLALFLETIGKTDIGESLKRVKDPLLLSDNVLHAIEQSKIVVVIDNYHKIKDSDLRKIIKFISENNRKSMIIIISRIRPADLLETGKVFEIQLGGLSFEETKEFIKSRKGKLKDKEIIELYIATQGIPVLLQVYRELKRIEPNTSILIFRKKNILSYIINEIYDHFNDEEKKLFSILITIDEPLELEAIKTVYEFRDLRKILRKFMERGLVEETTDNKYIIHDIFRSLYKKLSETVIKHIYSSIGRYYLEKNNPLDFLNALTYFYRAQDHIGIASLLKKRIMGDLDYHIYYIDKYKTILEEINKWSITDIRSKMYLDYELGHLYYLMGDFKKAYDKLTHALWLLESPRSDNELFLQILMFTDLSETLICQGIFDEAHECIKKAEETTNKIEDEKIRKYALFHLNGSKGLYYYYFGKINEAIKVYKERLRYGKEFDDPKYYFYNLVGLANLYEINEEYDKAIKALNIALDYALKTKKKYLEALTRMIISETYYRIGKYDEANKNISIAISVYDRIGLKMKLADSYILKSYIEYRLGNYEDSLKYAQKAYNYYKNMNTCDKANAIGGIIASLIKLNRREEAEKMLEDHKNLIIECKEHFEVDIILSDVGIKL